MARAIETAETHETAQTDETAPTGEKAQPDGVDTSDDTSWLNLGPCHYGPDEQATVIANRADGTGWIAVCDQHKEDARKSGFEPNE